MSNRMFRTEWEWTPELLTRAVDAWERITSHHSTSLSVDESYGMRPVRTGAGSNEGTRAHVTALVLADGDASETPTWGLTLPMTVDLISYGDYHGTEYDAANVYHLDKSQTPGVQVRGDDWRNHGERTAWMQIGELPGDHDTDGDDPTTGIEWIEHVADMIEGLENSPVLDDDARREYVGELRVAAWEQFMSADVTRELERDLITDDMEAVDLTDVPRSNQYATSPTSLDDIIRRHYYAAVATLDRVDGGEHCDGEGWHMENATSIVVPAERHARALSIVKRDVFVVDDGKHGDVVIPGSGDWS